MKRLLRKGQRGQSVVELAITSVMFVVVLLFGIFFAELGYISQKVQEAAAYAMYDTTSRRVTDFDEKNLTGSFAGVYKPYQSLNGYKGSAGAAEDLYKDFDGALDKGATIQQVMTAADQLQVRCRDDNSMSFALANGSSNRPGPWIGRVNQYLDNLYRDQGGLNCTASARVRAVNFPGSFLEKDKVLTQSELYDGDPIRVCGVGRAVSGQCTGSYALLTGDWSLDQADTGKPDRRVDNHSKHTRQGDPYGAKQNPGYRKLVEDLYMRNGDSKQAMGGGMTRAQEMISIGGGYTQGEVLAQQAWNDRKFLMSYAGVEDDFTDPINNTKDADNPTDTKYNTSGVYIPGWADPTKRNAAITSMKNRYKNCFLGIGREGCNKN